MKTADYSISNFNKVEHKYPVYRHIIYGVIMFFTLALVFAPIIFLIIEAVKAYQVGFSTYFSDLIELVKRFIVYFINEVHPVFALCALFLIIFMVFGYFVMVPDLLAPLLEPFKYSFDEKGLVCRNIFGNRVIAYENIFHIDESAINNTNNVSIHYMKRQKRKKLLITAMLTNFDSFVDKLKTELVAKNGFYYNVEYVANQELHAKTNLIKGLFYLFLFQAFGFFCMIGIRLNKGLELDILTMLIAVVFFFGLFFYIAWQSTQIRKFKYEDGKLHVEYIFFSKRSYDIRLEDIESAKSKDRIYLVISYRKNISKKSLTLNNVPHNGIDQLFEDLKKRGLITEGLTT